MGSRWKLIVLVALAVSTVTYLSLLAWHFQKGCVSIANYDRIAAGMDLGEVRTLLGSMGDEISIAELPRIGPEAKLAGSPDAWDGVVWGERFLRWQGSPLNIFVGLSCGKVISKYFLEFDG